MVQRIIHSRVIAPGPPGEGMDPGQVADVLSAVDRIDALESGNPVAYHNFRDDPDGPVSVLESGQDWHLVYTSDDLRMRVIDGALTTAATSGAVAGYAEVELPAPVLRIGATVRFTPKTEDGGLAALVIWKTDHITGGPIPDSPLHLKLSPYNISVDVWDSGVGPTLIGSETFLPPIPALELDGTTEYSVDVRIIDDTIEAYVSNGVTLVASHPKVAEHAGPWACWETYALNAATMTRAEFVEVWADTRRAGARSLAPTPYDIHTQAVQMAERIVGETTPVTAQYASNPADNKVLSGTVTELSTTLRLLTTFPASGKLLVTVSCFVEAAGAQVKLVGGWNDAFTATAFSQTVVNGSYVGQVSMTRLVTGTPGAMGFLRLGAQIIGGVGTATIRQDSVNGYVTTFAAAQV